MALTNFIPTIWSETLFRELEKNYVAVKLCNRDYEGDIKAYGDTVKITGMGQVSVYDYTRNTDIEAPETLDDTTRTLVINAMKYFNFVIDDVDKAQANVKLMQEAMKNAADALADAADQYIYGLTHTDMVTVPAEAVTSATVTAMVSGLRRRMLANNVKNSTPMYLEIPPEVEEKLILAKVLTDTDNSKALSQGYLGKFMGFEIYVTNNLPRVEIGDVLTPAVGEPEDEDYVPPVLATTEIYTCYARTKRAISFAEQINDTEAYRPELRFGDAVKGLHVYGGKIIYPKEILKLSVTVDEEA